MEHVGVVWLVRREGHLDMHNRANFAMKKDGPAPKVPTFKFESGGPTIMDLYKG